MKTSKQFISTALFKGQRNLMQLVFVEMYSSTIYASLDTAWLANYLAK